MRSHRSFSSFIALLEDLEFGGELGGSGPHPEQGRRRYNVKLAKAFLKLQSFLLASAHLHGKMGKSDQGEVSGCLCVMDVLLGFS